MCFDINFLFAHLTTVGSITMTVTTNTHQLHALLYGLYTGFTRDRAVGALEAVAFHHGACSKPCQVYSFRAAAASAQLP